jgi:PPOX class probable F420-dependent enzyme
MSGMNDQARTILRGKRNAYLATVMPDGSPQLTPVWVDVEGDDVVINTSEGTVKLANMRRDRRVALAIEAEEDRYKVLCVKGRVVDIESGAHVDEHIDMLSKRHDGVRWKFADGETRVRVRIHPERLQILSD